ncbi:MAG: serine/threonine-protein kinase, partial [Nocardioides sp.]|uniref:serine/threonine-protein kinase n=1 Tax=Nocardioides sp. TaxID=35761 RepID=UPI003F09F7B6
GILHRDIKPSNVLVTTYQEPALTDFGIAGHIADVEGDHDVRISYPWSPPELLDGTSNGSVASDVYSLGATVWHLLVGRSPFSIPSGDNSTRALSARILHAAPPATQRPDVPPALDRLLQQCLAKRPEHRPKSALELARALQRIEAAAGWPRTVIAVEGDQAAPIAPQPHDAHPDVDGATVMKAPTVISASAPRRVQAAQERQIEDRAPERAPRKVSGAVWAAVGAVVLAVLAGALFMSEGREDDPGANPDPGGITPSDPVVEVLAEAPTLEGRRTAKGVRFQWSSPEAQAGDEWLWQTDDAGFERTTRTSHVVASDKSVCLTIQLTRGAVVSPPTRQCVA